MKRLWLSLILLFPFSLYSWALEQQIRNIDIDVLLDRQGSAHITEVWDVDVASGTEWYLVRKNLGDIEISGLKVSDETGRSYRTLPVWDLDRSLSEKAGTCGINRLSDGCEICWGVGSYGSHIFRVSYVMSNAVKSLEDYDCFHMQLVSPGLSARPKQVSVEIHTDLAPLDSTNTRLWGFGFHGNAYLEDGSASYVSTETFSSNSSVIALLRFEKGIFNSPSRRNVQFEEVLDEALEGSSYEDDDDTFAAVFILLIVFVLSVFAIRSALKANGKIRDKKRLLSLFGVSDIKNLPWCREVPFDGDVLGTSFVASHLKGGFDGKNNFIEAFMLRMVQRSVLFVTRDGRGRISLAIADNADISYMGKAEGQFYKYVVAAAGKDRVLQPKEFKRWSLSHGEELQSLVDVFRAEVCSHLLSEGMADPANTYLRPKFTAPGQEKARNAVGFLKYLQEFTIIDERQTAEVALWKEYLVAASVFGIADKVAKELKELNPRIYEELKRSSGNIDPFDVLVFNRSFAVHYNNSLLALNASKVSDAAKGFGGGTSFGGGGGFSGGGFGGGSR